MRGDSGEPTGYDEPDAEKHPDLYQSREILRTGQAILLLHSGLEAEPRNLDAKIAALEARIGRVGRRLAADISELQQDVRELRADLNKHAGEH